MKIVNMIAGKYEWTCPTCRHLNIEIEVLEEVTCEKCGEVGEVEHAYGERGRSEEEQELRREISLDACCSAEDALD